MPSRSPYKLLSTQSAIPLIAIAPGIFGIILLTQGTPLFLVCFISVSFFFALYLSMLAMETRRNRVAAERKDETICSFARQLNCRETDTWIIRAVYEEFSDYFGYPPHLDDRFDKVDMDSLEIDELWELISKRIGRALDNTDKNPYFGKVETVRDFILFITEQPLVDSKTGQPA
jgi:hypothetical protein